MKKKNVLMMALSLALVAVIAVGGTLAYLSAQSDVVTNTFTTTNKIAMNLKEHKVVDGSSTSELVNSNSYADVVPLVAYPKDPSVQLTSVPTGGAYVFMAVKGLGTTGDFTATAAFDTTNWKKISEGDGQNGLYVYIANEVAATVDDSQSGDERMPALFTTVNFDYDNNATGNPSTIEVVAFAAQAENTVFANVAAQALSTLNTALTLGDAGYALDSAAVATVTPAAVD